MDENICSLARELYTCIGSPLAMRYKKALDEGDWDFIRNNRIDPTRYDNYDRFASDYTAQEFLRKYPDLPGSDLKQRVAEAERSFYASERDCYVTNHRLRTIREGGFSGSEALLALISQIQSIISSVIGQHPPAITPTLGGFGPGSTYCDKGKKILLPDKLAKRPSRTYHAFDHYPTMFDYISSWGPGGDLCNIVQGNRFTTVPKDSKTERGICIEPSVNLFYQKGVGSLIRSRLKKQVGIDLEKGQMVHGELALNALKRGLATIDLSSASDTVSLELVRLLLPTRWTAYLEQLRSPKTLFKGKWVVLEKFSSMGNGFTFELETLIFYAISRAVCGPEGLVSAYGDDIIVPEFHAPNVLSTLQFFGFKPNPKKTFIQGPFRESCGSDAFLGMLVPTTRLDSAPCDAYDWIAVHNRLRYCFARIGRFSSVHRLLKRCIDNIPYHLRLYGPEQYGDACIHAETALWHLKRGESFEDRSDPLRGKLSTKAIPGTTWIRVHKTTVVPLSWSYWSEEVMLLSRLYQPSDFSAGITGRGLKEVVGQTWVSVS